MAAEAARRRAGVWDPDSCGAGPSHGVTFAMKVKWDADGSDGVNVNGEWVRIHNRSATETVSLRGWSMRDAYLREYDFPHQYKFPRGAILGPRESVRVRVGNGQQHADGALLGRA